MNDRALLPFEMDVSSRFNPSFPEMPISIDIRERVGSLVFLDPRRIKPLEGQPRNKFRGIPKLSLGIKKVGQKTPILVCPIDDPEYDAELIEGERRTRACLLGQIMIRAEVRPCFESEEEHFADSFVANFDRAGLTSLETAKGVARLIDSGYTPQDIVEMTGKTASWVAQYSSLSKLHPDVLKLLDEERDEQYDGSGRKLRRKTALPLSAALHLSRIEHQEQFDVVQMIIEQKLSVSKAGVFVRRYLEENGKVVRRRNRTAPAFVGQLERTADRFDDLLARYLDMKVTDLRDIVFGYNSKKLTEVARKLQNISSQLNGLASSLLPKGSLEK